MRMSIDRSGGEREWREEEGSCWILSVTSRSIEIEMNVSWEDDRILKYVRLYFLE